MNPRGSTLPALSLHYRQLKQYRQPEDNLQHEHSPIFTPRWLHFRSCTKSFINVLNSVGDKQSPFLVPIFLVPMDDSN